MHPHSPRDCKRDPAPLAQTVFLRLPHTPCPVLWVCDDSDSEKGGRGKGEGGRARARERAGWGGCTRERSEGVRG